MEITLTPAENLLRTKIVELMEKIRQASSEAASRKNVYNWIYEAGDLAHQLHISLKNHGQEPKHHDYMIKNRGVQPDNKDFYIHLHPIEDLLKIIGNPHANDDPVDQTVGSEFIFSVFSRRQGHPDAYRLTRTIDGWDVRHIAIGGPCDKGGHPFLFKNFEQDSIQYPSDLAGWLTWLWDQAASQGLPPEKVQEALQQLADWVSLTEQNAPKLDVLQGYA